MHIICSNNEHKYLNIILCITIVYIHIIYKLYYKKNKSLYYLFTTSFICKKIFSKASSFEDMNFSTFFLSKSFLNLNLPFFINS